MHTDDSLSPLALIAVSYMFFGVFLLSSNHSVFTIYSTKLSIEGFVSITSSLCKARSPDTSREYLHSSYPGFSTHTPTLDMVRTEPPLGNCLPSDTGGGKFGRG